jgi:hypothetical protein
METIFEESQIVKLEDSVYYAEKICLKLKMGGNITPSLPGWS